MAKKVKENPRPDVLSDKEKETGKTAEEGALELFPEVHEAFSKFHHDPGLGYKPTE